MPKIRKPQPTKTPAKPARKAYTLEELYDILDKVRLTLVRQVEVLYSVTAELARRGVEGHPPMKDDTPF